MDVGRLTRMRPGTGAALTPRSPSCQRSPPCQGKQSFTGHHGQPAFPPHGHAVGAATGGRRARRVARERGRGSVIGPAPVHLHTPCNPGTSREAFDGPAFSSLKKARVQHGVHGASARRARSGVETPVHRGDGPCGRRGRYGRFAREAGHRASSRAKRPDRRPAPLPREGRAGRCRRAPSPSWTPC